MIADAIKESGLSPEQMEQFARRIAQPLSAENPRFDINTFVNYVLGKGGPRPKRQGARRAPTDPVA